MSGLTIFIGFILLIGIYLIIRAVTKGKKGDDKLINRSVPPLDPDNKKAGGGTPRDTYPGQR